MIYVAVVQNEGEVPVELPLEEDSTLLLTTLEATFPKACGLVFRCSANGIVRGVRLSEGRFHAPEGGWKDQVFICSANRDEKRKSEEESEAASSTKMPRLTSDLIILGLPWKTTDEQVKEYFEQYGEVAMATVKKNPRTGQSKGFGFVRFADLAVQTQVAAQRHTIDGRWCDVKIPYSQAVDASQACKIFVGQLKAGVTQEEIKEYFVEFGEVSDVYIPQPFRQFAFVTFSDPFTAKTVCSMLNHSINGSPVNVSVAIPPARKSDGPYDAARRASGPLTPRPPVKRRLNDNYSLQYGDQNSYFNNSGEWNAKQGREGMMWDESSWDVGQYNGYTTVRGMGY